MNHDTNHQTRDFFNSLLGGAIDLLLDGMERQ